MFGQLHLQGFDVTKNLDLLLLTEWLTKAKSKLLENVKVRAQPEVPSPRVCPNWGGPTETPGFCLSGGPVGGKSRPRSCCVSSERLQSFCGENPGNRQNASRSQQGGRLHSVLRGHYSGVDALGCFWWPIYALAVAGVVFLLLSSPTKCWRVQKSAPRWPLRFSRFVSRSCWASCRGEGRVWTPTTPPFLRLCAWVLSLSCRYFDEQTEALKKKTKMDEIEMVYFLKTLNTCTKIKWVAWEFIYLCLKWPHPIRRTECWLTASNGEAYY